MRFTDQEAALTRKHVFQRLEAATRRRVGTQACYPSFARARSSSRRAGHRGTALHAPGDGRFVTPTPYIGAGMGHQVCTWSADRVIADLLGIRFAHTPIAEPWESHLNLSSGEVSARDLRTAARTIRLPRIDYESGRANDVEHDELARVVATYKPDSPIVFRLALDQSRYDLTSAGPALMEKYWLGRRHTPPSTELRIAVHVRRGDVAAMREAGEGTWAERWLGLDYFEAALASIDASIGRGARRVVVVSEGDPSDFSTLVRSFDAQLLLGGDPTVAFDRLVNSDILVASPSGFSDS